jgi:hypothetical protein
MAQIEVYNPKVAPVIYGDGQTIGGLEWAFVEEELVLDHLSENNLILVDRNASPENDQTQENTEEVSTDDSSIEESEVSSDLENKSDVAEDSVDDAPSDAPTTTEEAATISKPRRKRTTTERE